MRYLLVGLQNFETIDGKDRNFEFVYLNFPLDYAYRTVFRDLPYTIMTCASINIVHYNCSEIVHDDLNDIRTSNTISVCFDTSSEKILEGPTPRRRWCTFDVSKRKIKQSGHPAYFFWSSVRPRFGKRQGRDPIVVRGRS
mmetsp:Transcript_27870/g.61390  ORF Transcript_27870/g.61390 Transcript_27870/m.61390 type:complete len:140 (-) Transcript_27870:2101-2520(-)